MCKSRALEVGQQSPYRGGLEQLSRLLENLSPNQHTSNL